MRSTIARLTSDIAAHIECATQTFLSEDMEGADRIIARDPENQATCADVEERCYRLLALQAPVACDLRAIIAALWIIAEVGRCGDHAVAIGERVTYVVTATVPPRTRR